MATDQEFVDFLADQMEGAGDISFKKMFGEYALYCDGKVVATVRDAAYEDNRATIALDPVKASVVELRITGSYGASPAIRELEILSESAPAKEGKP